MREQHLENESVFFIKKLISCSMQPTVSITSSALIGSEQVGRSEPFFDRCIASSAPPCQQNKGGDKFDVIAASTASNPRREVVYRHMLLCFGLFWII